MHIAREGDKILAPFQHMCARLEFRAPERPKMVVPNNRLVNIMDVGRWCIVMAEENVVPLFKASGLTASKPVPVYYAAPPGVRAAPPSVPGWQVKVVPWEKLAPPALKDSKSPLVAVNLAALADLYAVRLPASPDSEGKGASGSDDRSPSAGPEPAEPRMPANKKGLTLKEPTLPANKKGLAAKEPVHPKLPANKKGLTLKEPNFQFLAGKTLVAAPFNRGIYKGNVQAQSDLLDRLNERFSQWMEDLKMKREERPQLILHVTDDGEYITGKSLLEDIEEKGALLALQEAFGGDSHAAHIGGGGSKPPSLVIMWPHLKLYAKQYDIYIKGIAANGQAFKCTSEDEMGFWTFFDFVPHPPDIVIPLIPFFPGMNFSN